MLKENIQALKWLLKVSSGNRVFLLLSICLAVAAGAVSVMPFLFLYQVMNALFQETLGPELLRRAALGSLLTIAARYLLQFASTLCSHKAAFYIQFNVRKRLLEHLGNLPLGFFSKRSSGQLRKIICEDIENLEIYIAHHIPDTCMSIAVPLMVFGVMFAEQPFLPIILAIPLLLMFLALSALNRIRKNYVQEYFDNTEQMNTATVEYIKAIPVIKIFNIGVEAFSKFYNSVQKQIAITSTWITKSTFFYVLFRSSTDMVLLLVMIALTVALYAGNASAPPYILCFVLGSYMARPINQIYTSSNLLCSLMEGAKRVEGIMRLQPLKGELPADAVTDLPIRYEDVSFSYAEENILEGININIDKPGLYAFVGESGSGKTTAAQLLLRFWEINQGAVSIGGADTRSIRPEAIMKHISFSFQDSFILDGSVKENIHMNQPGIGDEQIEKAAGLSEAHEFIKKMPAAYDTVIGEGGVRVSGGEKQRICLARAIVKDCPILILDEPTSHVDGKTERRMIEAIKSYCAENVVLFITHRLLSVVNADRIFVFERGRIIDSGRHAELLSRGGRYCEMFNLAEKANAWSIKARG